MTVVGYMFFTTLFFLVFLMYLSLFLIISFGLGLGKVLDMCRYYRYVFASCCFAPFSCSEKSEIIDMMYRFNSVLDEPYQFTDDDSDAFIEIYKNYRLWLMEKYMKNDFYFSKYKKSFSLSKKKGCQADTFFSVFGSSSRDFMFLAFTFAIFSEQTLESLGAFKATVVKDHKLFVLGKAYLSSLQMLCLAYPQKYNRYVNNAKDIVAAL